MRTLAEEALYYLHHTLPLIDRSYMEKADQSEPANLSLGMHYLINPQFEKDFEYNAGHLDIRSGVRSGDILTERGKSEVSSLIARVPAGEEADGQVSHTFIIHIDAQGRKFAIDQKGKIHSLEALIETGFKIRPLTVLDQPVSRYSIYRMREPQIAARGAQLLYNEELAAEEAGIDTPYDFPMENQCGYSCAGAVRKAILLGSDGKIDLSTFKTTIEMDDPWILDQINIRNGIVTYAPGDGDIEPLFNLVLLARDPGLSHQALQLDAILTTLLNMMNEGYEMRPIWKSSITSRLLLPIRKAMQPYKWTWNWPILKQIKASFPEYMKANELDTIVRLRNLVWKFYDDLSVTDLSRAKMNGHSMSWSELRAEVEAIYERRADLQNLFFQARPPADSIH